MATTNSNEQTKPYHFSPLPFPIRSKEKAEESIKSIADSFKIIRQALDYLSRTQAYIEMGQKKSWDSFVKHSLPDLHIKQANILLSMNNIERNLNLGDELGTVPLEVLKMLDKLPVEERKSAWLLANDALVQGGSVIESLKAIIKNKMLIITADKAL